MYIYQSGSGVQASPAAAACLFPVKGLILHVCMCEGIMDKNEKRANLRLARFLQLKGR